MPQKTLNEHGGNPFSVSLSAMYPPTQYLATILSLAVALVLTNCSTSTSGMSSGTTTPKQQMASQAQARYSTGLSAVRQALKSAQVEAHLADRQLQAHRAISVSSLRVENALIGAATEFEGWWQTPASSPDYKVILRERGDFSVPVSWGTTASGRLYNPATLGEQGRYHKIIDRARPRNTRYATPAMIRLILDSAQHVAERFPQSRLSVGNLSRWRGGDIPWSHSHNSGRDADIAFYTQDNRNGSPRETEDLYPFDDYGRAIGRPEIGFDTPRNWALVRALLTHPQVDVQWIFVSEGLKRMLLEFAAERQEPLWLMERAAVVLHQPSDSAPHNDHFHVRITCARKERLKGCINGGPHWAWVDWHRPALRAQAMSLMEGLQDPDPEIRLEVLNFLQGIESPFTPEVALFQGVYDQDPRVRRAAIEIAHRAYSWSSSAVVGAMRFIESDKSDMKDKRLAYSILRRSLNPLVMEFTQDRLHNEGVTIQEKVIAASALAHHMEPSLVPFLLTELDAQPAAVRGELASVLRRIANREFSVDWTNGDKRVLEKGLSAWRAWWENNRDLPRYRWVERGFKTAGIQFEQALTAETVDELISFLRQAPDHLRYNANRTLREATGHWAPLEQKSGMKLFYYWSRWWRKHRQFWEDDRHDSLREMSTRVQPQQKNKILTLTWLLNSSSLEKNK